MIAFNILFKSISPLTLFMGAATVISGTAAAALHGNLELLPAILCLIFAIFAQTAANIAHRYIDECRNAGENIDDKISGTSESGLPTSLILKEGFMSATFLAGMIGCSIATMTGWWAFAWGLLIFVLAWAAYTGPTLIKTPWGLLITFILFGPLGVIGTSLVQSLHEATNPLGWYDLSPALYLSGVVGLMAVNCHLTYNFSSYHQDQRNQKRTFSIVFGRKSTRVLFLANSLIWFALMLAMCVNLHPQRWGLDMIAAVISIIINGYIWNKMRTTSRHLSKQLVLLSIINITGMAITNLIFFIVTGAPDDSRMIFFH